MADAEILAPATMASARPPILAERLTVLRQIGRQPAVRRTLPAIGMVGAVSLAALAWWGLQTPARTPLFQGLADADKAAVADALQGAGIAYGIDAATGTIQVDEDSMHRARMMLAAQGLPKAAPSGDALLARLPMGSSRAVEGETLRGAREMDLARTIEAIDAVKTARIHLAMPEPSVFVREEKAPAASVMLTLQQGRTLSEAQVRAIRHLVASSVPGLAPDQVSIIDQSGALLSQDDNSADSIGFQHQLRLEDRYRQAIVALLGPVVGRDNFTAEVHVDIDRSESQSTRETYPKDDRALRREEGNRSNTVEPVPAMGIPGALANQPPRATVVAATPGGAQPVPPPSGEGLSAETYNRTFDVGREISVTHQPQGQMSRLTVAVALRDQAKGRPRPAQEVAAIEALVKGAVGYDAQRGDVVAISSRPFAPVEEVPQPVWDAPWFLPLARQVGALLVALLVLIFVGRPLLKSLRARSANHAALEQQLLTATGEDRVAAGQGRMADEITIEMIEAAPGYEQRAGLVRQFVRQNPDRAAMIVRQLVQERNHG